MMNKYLMSLCNIKGMLSPAIGQNFDSEKMPIRRIFHESNVQWVTIDIYIWLMWRWMDEWIRIERNNRKRATTTTYNSNKTTKKEHRRDTHTYIHTICSARCEAEKRMNHIEESSRRHRISSSRKRYSQLICPDAWLANGSAHSVFFSFRN